MNVSIIVPCYNEEKSIGELVEAIDRSLKPRSIQYEIIFVDDGSVDGTFEACRQARNKNGTAIKVYRFTRNYGKSAALSFGIEKAAGEAVITMDADLQDDPAAIPDMLKLLQEGWDVVSGWKRSGAIRSPRPCRRNFIMVLQVFFPD